MVSDKLFQNNIGGKQMIKELLKQAKLIQLLLRNKPTEETDTFIQKLFQNLTAMKLIKDPEPVAREKKIPENAFAERTIGSKLSTKETLAFKQEIKTWLSTQGQIEETILGYLNNLTYWLARRDKRFFRKN